MAQMDWLTANNVGGFAPMVQGPNYAMLSKEDQDRIRQMDALRAQTVQDMGPQAAVPASPEAHAMGDLPFAPSAGLPTSLESPEDKAFQEKNRALYSQLIDQSQKGIATDQANLENVKNLQGAPDFTPWASVLDSWNGGKSNLAQAAQLARGMKPEEKAALIEKLNQAITGKQEALAGIVGKNVDNKDAMQNQLKLMGMAQQNQRQQNNLDLKKEDELRTDVTKTITDPARNDIKAMASMDTAFASGDSQKISGVLAQYARSISGEKGVLTDEDIKRVVGPNWQGSAAKTFAFFGDTPSAQLTPEYTKNLQEMIAMTKQKLAEKYQAQLESRKKEYQAGVYAPLMQPGRVGDVITQQADAAVKSLYTPPAPTAPSPGGSSVDDIVNKYKNQNQNKGR